MPSKRPVILIAILVTGFCSAFLLPKSFGIRESAIIHSMPAQLDEWKAFPQETPERVRQILGEETKHANAIFVRRAPNSLSVEQYDRLHAFIVLSGSDMNASIHRPERCFPAQGMRIVDSSERSIPIDDHPTLNVTRLVATGTLGDGQTFDRIAYYWFVGHDEITNNHYGRTFIDMRDRVLKGYNQRWAYVMVSLDYGYKSDESKIRQIDEAEADAMVQSFIPKLVPHIHNQDQLRN